MEKCKGHYQLSTRVFEHKLPKKVFPKNGEKEFQELTIKAFSEKEVNQYIINYVQKKGDLSEDTYLQQITNIPEELVSILILLKITLSVLSRFIEQDRTAQINRIALYNEFLKTWFDHAHDRLYKIHKTHEEEEEFVKLDRKDFSKPCLQFSKKLSVEMDDDIKNSLLRFKSLESPLHATQSSQHATLFKEQSFVFEHGVRQFLIEHILQKMETLKPKLLAFIEASKKDDKIQIILMTSPKWHRYFDDNDVSDWSILGFHEAWIHENKDEIRRLNYQKANDALTKSLRSLINDCKDEMKMQEAARLLANKASTSCTSYGRVNDVD
ncbi:7408_t:CDS:2 [Cetraspora pellucida]|uniref:7408_t:CDS:1 n=1 Tax=Cetraspora pellucida TaxID=1433469 RepID=A0ACA9KA94_9GLOM|nr:7408_t:CDS:2 [Cetraspora pellucida]